MQKYKKVQGKVTYQIYKIPSDQILSTNPETDRGIAWKTTVCGTAQVWMQSLGNPLKVQLTGCSNTLTRL